VVIDPQVLQQVSDELQAYVYMLIDPDSGIPFYVGKGHGLRYHDHVTEARAIIPESVDPADEPDDETSRKLQKINEIWIEVPVPNPRSGSSGTAFRRPSTRR
jgi:hypothetical protein